MGFLIPTSNLGAAMEPQMLKDPTQPQPTGGLHHSVIWLL